MFYIILLLFKDTKITTLINLGTAKLSKCYIFHPTKRNLERKLSHIISIQQVIKYVN